MNPQDFHKVQNCSMFKKSSFDVFFSKVILFAILFLCFCTAIRAEDDNNELRWRNIANETFRPLALKSLSEKNRQDLLARNIDPDKVAEAYFPSKWRCNVQTFPPSWVIQDKGNEGLYVKADPEIQFYLSSIEVARDAFRVEVKAMGPGGLKVGITFAENPSLSFVKEAEKDQNGFFHFTYESPAGTASVITLRIFVSGEVNLLSATIDAKSDESTSVIEGTLTDISFLPPVEEIVEDDCYFTAECKVNQTLDGPKLPRNIRVLLPGILQRELATGATLRRNSKCRLTLKPFANCVEEQQMARQVNSLEDDLTPVYLATEIRSLNRFSMDSQSGDIGIHIVPSDFVGRFTESEEGISAKVAGQAQTSITDQLAKATETLRKTEEAIAGGLYGKFSTTWAEQYADMQKLDDGRAWRFDGNAAWALPENFKFDTEKKISNRILTTIKSFRDFLYARGCRLLVQIVPSSDSVAARRIIPGFADLPDPASARATSQLLAAGIEAISADELLVGASSESIAPALFIYPINNELGDNGQDILARQAAKYIETQFPGNTFSAISGTKAFIERDHTFYDKTEMHQWPKNVDFTESLAGKRINCKEILVNNQSFRPNMKSALLVFGNHIVHEPTPLCNYAARLAKSSGIVPDALAIAGETGWITSLMHLYRNQERFLDGKKLVVFPIYADELCVDHSSPDLHKLDDANVQLKDKVQLCELKVLDFPTRVDSIKLPAASRSLWRSFLFTTAYLGTFSKTNLTKTLRTITIPEELRNRKGLICRIRCALHFSAPQVELNVNGKNYTIIAPSEDMPQWQDLDVPIKSGTENLSIKVTAFSDATIFAIRDITLVGEEE